VGALRAQAATLSERADGGPLHVLVEAPEQLVELPAAVEVAAYRITTEALTNVARHSTASVASVTLTADDGALTWASTTTASTPTAVGGPASG